MYVVMPGSSREHVIVWQEVTVLQSSDGGWFMCWTDGGIAATLSGCSWWKGRDKVSRTKVAAAGDPAHSRVSPHKMISNEVETPLLFPFPPPVVSSGCCTTWRSHRCCFGPSRWACSLPLSSQHPGFFFLYYKTSLQWPFYRSRVFKAAISSTNIQLLNQCDNHFPAAIFRQVKELHASTSVKGWEWMRLIGWSMDGA